MRILKVHNYYTQPGGEDTVFHAETNLLRSRGHEVIEFIEHNEKIKGMNKTLVALQTIWSQSSYRKLKRFLKDTKPDVVHFHNTFPLISPAAYYACRALEIPVVQTLDNQRLICPAATFYRDGKLCLDCMGKTPPLPGVLHACYHNSRMHTAVVASMLTVHRWLRTWKRMVDIFLCSTDFYRGLFAQCGLPLEKMIVMPHFVKPPPPAHSKKGDYAVFVGRLDPEKGLNILLDAWRSLDIPLKIRGNGSLSQRAREFVRSHNMQNIEFVERVDAQGLSDLIGGARFLVVPSGGYYETFSMVTVEAYSHGVPVIAPNIGVSPELVSDGQTGSLFDSGNSNDLAKKAMWIHDHPDEAEAMGGNGRKVFEMRYTEERCYQTLIEAYGRLSAKK